MVMSLTKNNVLRVVVLSTHTRSKLAVLATCQYFKYTVGIQMSDKPKE